MNLFNDLDLVSKIAALATFGLVLALWCFGVLWWIRRNGAQKVKIKQRLEESLQAEGAPRTLRLWHEGEVATTTVDGDFRQLTLRERLEQLVKDAGWDAPLTSIALVVGMSLLVTALGTILLTKNVVAGLITAPAVAIVFWWYINMRADGCKKAFERQLVDGLELSSRALRAGHPLLAAFHLIADEIPAPVGTMFSEICQQQDMGVKLEDSLRRAAALSRSADMKLFAATLTINLRSGGNLAEVVDGLALVIRQRMRLNRRFRVVIAQTQFSKRILLGLPMIMFGVLNILNAEYVAPLYSTHRGNMLLLAAAGALAIGWWSMNKMAAITD
jgi:tight adherence protein B